MIFIDMGGGKSALTLMLIRYRKACGERFKAVIMVPYITSVETWVEESAKFTPELQCVPLLGTTSANLARLSGPGDLFVICYQSAVAMVTTRGDGEWLLKASDVRKHFDGFDMLVLDEAHRCRDVTSLSYRMCRAISSQAEWVIGLTGTPFGKDPTPLWPQFYLIDFGETLGPTLSFYRSVFFNSKPGYFGGMERTFKKRLLPTLKRLTKNRSIHYSLDEFADMPPLVPCIREITAPAVSEDYITLAKERLEKADNYQEINSSYIQLCQLSSGFLTLKGQDTGKIQIAFDENPKLDACMEIIEGMPPDCKAVVFHKFIFSNGVVSERLKKAKIKHARIWGGQRDPIGELRRFKSDPNCRVLVLNTRSGSSSLNLQNANFLIFYEQPDDPIDRQQAERRVWRPGQSQRVFLYDLLVRGTWDRRIWQSNKDGESLLKRLLTGSGGK